MWVPAAWAAYLAIFAVHYFRVRGHRGSGGRRDPGAAGGVALEAVSILLLWFFPVAQRSGMRLPAALLFLGALVLTAVSLRHLGTQWRIRAVVADDHRLVTTGPYARLRHPLYLALLAMVLAHSAVATAWPAAVVAVALCAAGNQIRIRAEDRLLMARFPEARDYLARVPAYLPRIR